MFYIYPYKMASASAKRLRDAVGGRLIKLENSRYSKKPSHTVINWGNSSAPDYVDLNKPDAVGRAANKLATLQTLRENNVPHVPFTTEQETANDWLASGAKVFARHSLTGHSGEGIEVLQDTANRTELDDISSRLWGLGFQDLAEQVAITADELALPLVQQAAPLYTKGITNAGEYRVHVFNGSVICYQKKSRRVDNAGNVITAEGEAADVRNLASNWIYRTGNLERLERIEQLAISAISVMGLDFGAVDIIKDEEGNVFVLEINSAPGLGNTDTLQAYTNAFNSIN